MPPELDLIFPIMRVVAAVSMAGAVVVAYKLYSETDRGWYWLSLLLSAFFMALSQWILIIFPLIRSFEILGILRDASEIVATLLFALSCYGIYKTMKEIRKRVE